MQRAPCNAARASTAQSALVCFEAKSEMLFKDEDESVFVTAPLCCYLHSALTKKGFCLLFSKSARALLQRRRARVLEKYASDSSASETFTSSRFQLLFTEQTLLNRRAIQSTLVPRAWRKALRTKFSAISLSSFPCITSTSATADRGPTRSGSATETTQNEKTKLTKRKV